MKKIFIYILIIITAGYAVREVMYYGIRKNEKGIFDKYNTIFLRKNNFETVIIGSSRAESHFNTLIIDSALHTNSFDIGIQGASLPFALDVFNAYLENSEFPRNIIFNIDSHINRCDNDTVFMFPRYFPYLSNRTLYNALEKRDKRFAAFKFLPYYGLAYMGDNYCAAALRGYFNNPGKYDLDYYKGYTPVRDVKWNYKRYYACDDNSMYDRIDSLAALCRIHHSNLYLVESPIFCKASNEILNKRTLSEKLNLKVKSNRLTLYDYSNDSICNDSSLFADPYHMNELGAKMFTEKLVKELKGVWNHGE